MADNDRGDRDRDRGDHGDHGDRGGRKPRGRRRKVCAFCVDKVTAIDYKDTAKLRRYITERGKMLPRRMTGNCAAHQRHLSVAIKRARVMAMLPYSVD